MYCGSVCVCVGLDRQQTVSVTGNKMKSWSSLRRFFSLGAERQAVIVLWFLCVRFLVTLMGFKLAILFKLMKKKKKKLLWYFPNGAAKTVLSHCPQFLVMKFWSGHLCHKCFKGMQYQFTSHDFKCSLSPKCSCPSVSICPNHVHLLKKTKNNLSFISQKSVTCLPWSKHSASVGNIRHELLPH